MFSFHAGKKENYKEKLASLNWDLKPLSSIAKSDKTILSGNCFGIATVHLDCYPWNGQSISYPSRGP